MIKKAWELSRDMVHRINALATSRDALRGTLMQVRRELRPEQSYAARLIDDALRDCPSTSESLPA